MGAIMSKFETQTHEQRFALGIICGLLPIGCLLFGLFGAIRGVNYDGWYESISATYFANSNFCMIGALALCSFFLITYKGYDLGDRIYTLIAAVSAPLIVAFPCAAAPIEYVGLFACPIKTSNIIHMIAAIALFGSFALMTLKQFTKGSHRRRNTIYRICGWSMLMFMAIIGIGYILNFPGYTTMICETGMLWAFSVAWIIKSGIFPKI